MEQIIASIMPFAVAVALSPMPIVALVLMLLSNKARINSVMFLLGWIIGLAVLVLGVSYLVNLQSQSASSNSGVSVKAIIDGVLGVVLLIIAVKQWKQRPKPGETPKIPGWMSTIESFSPFKALGVGFLLATVNFKNTPMGIATGSAISKLSNSSEQSITALIIYLLIASCTISIPVIGFLLFGSKLQNSLTSLKNWLINNNATIMFVLFLLLGVMLLSKAFGG